MCRTDLIFLIFSVVSQEYEISAYDITSTKRDSDTVDARRLVAYYLWKNGCTMQSIGNHLHVSRQAASKLVASVPDRRRQSNIFNIIYLKCEKSLSESR